MFPSLKLYIGQQIPLEDILSTLTDFRYRRAPSVVQEGDFSQRGEILDIFPLNFDGPIRLVFQGEIIESIASFNIQSAKVIWQHKIVFISPRPAGRKETEKFTADTPINHFVDIMKGDFVVHNVHGIGKYLGVERRRGSSGGEQDHFVIEYQGGDRLFVPDHDLHLIQKYISFTKRPPRLFKLGSKEWARIKRQIQKRLERTAAELLHLQALRASLKGFAFSQNESMLNDFAKTFPFTETPDQIKSMLEVTHDMENEAPMDRVLCGDVGFGKTEVAVRAAFKAALDGKQTLVLVPTTILAEQHYYTFSNRMKDFPVQVQMLSRFRTPHQQREILRGLHAGTIDIVIGTHRLLSSDISFKNLGLIIIDEEHRFGVKAKERIKHYKLLADVLTMTATPIPRTLYMALSGARDMSVISTPPPQRVPVLTQITEFDEDVIQLAIEQELNRHGQVFFLHNRVEDIEKIAKIIHRLVPQARLGIGHGQMPARLLENIMLAFLKGEINVLVCTTIIESGIDIPNANTLIVNRADRFGLAELHQLRGRVGRSTTQAFALFLIPPQRSLANIARSRLKALEKYSELGAGFQIAFEDLQIRGAGNLLGEEQSGFIAAVGFDLYCRLLKQSIDNLKRAQDNHATTSQ